MEGSYSLQYLTPIADEEEQSEASAADGEAHTHSEERSWPVALWALGAVCAIAVAAMGVRLLRARSRPASEAR